ncbi:hypothetical protein SARC_12059 [Sphaeroforma arctica JP610]|uniref:Peptidase C1A papain C-terminal domain-containing protein n=1 Tax=Sphaeroforma arctica JP610 TaxID=667725 RepID=A0A0L0FF82_9EUKA|nr:hypothetical protein SARC_12059 [Sphaeroforma arctica JP610]KNC75415.1 hypothetical protein SARC_12059 [Sphaeroforma arctica JP610]|eukprot:XP_014149317.1 hypothetical protein SARC_12059 [Sphaeroforma arctica JP610]
MKSAIAIVFAALYASVEAGCYGNNPRPAPLTHEEKEALSYNHDPIGTNDVRAQSIPDAWDWNDVDGKSYLTPSWNQHIPKYCGSCWLHSSLSVVQDRIKIMHGGDGIDVMLARQVLVQCAPLDGMSNGCGGGDPKDVFGYMQKYGLPDEGCMVYKADDTDYNRLKKEGVKECPAEGICVNCMTGHKPECYPIKKPLLYGVKSWGVIGKGEEAMKAEIYNRGPIVCSIATGKALDYGYRGGVFIDHNNVTDVDHDIEVVGWGEEDGVPFWKIRNSWGTFWGEMGFFKLRRGTNELQVEQDCWAAVPDISMEQDVLDGKLVGSMDDGLVKKTEL